MPRKRINLSLSPREYARLTKICESYNFDGPCELVTALIHLFIKRVAFAESTRNRERITDPTITEEVMEMFDKLSDYEPTPSNTHARVQHREIDSNNDNYE